MKILKEKAQSPERSAAEEILKGLNPRQEEAVLHGEGPLLVVAGAGTGKTTVLTRRVAHLISSRRAAPSEILALTFTDKAASEMEIRVDRLVPYGFVDVHVSTFHAFGDKLLREFALDMGLIPDFRVLTQGESAVFLKQHLFDLPLSKLRPLGNPSKYAEALLAHISRLKDEDISPEKYCEMVAHKLKSVSAPEEKEQWERYQEAALAYARYEEIKLQEGFLDFGDQVTLTLKLLRSRPEVLKKIQARFKYILVDEFQDTNHAQFQLVQQLARSHRNVTVVGDDDQGIYRFRGASLANILNFLEVYPSAKVISITENYRSTQTILDNAYRLIRYNDPDRLEVRRQISKQLRAQGVAGSRIRLFNFHLQEEEADFVARKIKEEVQSKKRDFGDYAILVRSNDAARPYLESLNYFQIPWSFSAETQIMRSPYIKTLVSFLKVVADPYDSAYLFHLATSSYYDLTPAEMAPLNHESRISNRPLFEMISHPEKYQELFNRIDEEALKKIKKLRADLKEFLDLSVRESTGRVLYKFLEKHGVLSDLARSESWEDVLKAKTLAKFFGILKRFSEINLLDHPRAFVEDIESILEGESAEVEDLTEDRVHVLTVHKAKGLEFPVVFMVHLVEDQFPARKRGEFLPVPETAQSSMMDTHVSEERRLFYVGMTRGKEELYLSWAMGSAKRARRPSRFILEALGGPKEMLDVSSSATPLQAIELASRVSPNPVSLKSDSLSTPIGSDQELQLSAYAIDDYLTCPYKYKLSHVLRVPVSSHHSVVYGSAVHEAIKAFNLSKLQEKKFSLEEMLKVFERAWISEGFQSREHEEKRFAQGKKVLERFYKDNKGRAAPKAVEEEFKFYLGKNRIVGRFDAIEERKEGPAVVDYKTSEVEDQEKADQKAKESLQMGLYALGFEKKYGSPPQSLELHFVESGVVGRIHPDEKAARKLETRIEEAASGIRARKFQAKPDYFTCSFCAYQWICPEAYHKK